MENLRISTMTAVCNISDEINLKTCYDKLVINDIIHFIQKNLLKRKEKLKTRKYFIIKLRFMYF